MSEWIEWKGGECPVPGKKVSVMFRGAGTGAESGPGLAEVWDWEHDGEKFNGEIVAYRIIKEGEE